MKNLLRSFSKRASIAGVAAAAALGMASQAHAATCASLPNPVYIAGSSAVKPFAALLAAELSAAGITLIYAGPGSCVGVGYMTTNPPGKLTGGGTYWDTTLATPAFTGTCTTDDANGGDIVNIGVSDVYADSCAATLDAGVKDFHGPVQTMTFVVPIGTNGSTQTIISAEAAYLIYGFGGTSHPVTPWDDVTYIEQRGPTSGTQQMMSAFLNVPAAKFQGHPNSGSGPLTTSLAMSLTNGNAEKAIGILAADAADKNRPTLRELALQYYGQSCTYLPDSKPAAVDKANVRDGHYPIWGPLHLITPVTAGVPSDANAKKVIDYLTGAVTPSTFDMIQTEAKGGVVPDCAMGVSQKQPKDASEIQSYTPDHSCACKFEVEAANAVGLTPPASCKACTAANGTKDTAHCGSSGPNICNFGYCEAK